MGIGFVLGGTRGDIQATFAREASVLFPGLDPSSLPSSTPDSVEPEDAGTSAAQPNANASLNLTGRQQRALWSAVRARHNFWETLDEIEPGALARVFTLV